MIVSSAIGAKSSIEPYLSCVTSQDRNARAQALGWGHEDPGP